MTSAVTFSKLKQTPIVKFTNSPLERRGYRVYETNEGEVVELELIGNAYMDYYDSFLEAFESVEIHKDSEIAFDLDNEGLGFEVKMLVYANNSVKLTVEVGLEHKTIIFETNTSLLAIINILLSSYSEQVKYRDYDAEEYVSDEHITDLHNQLT